MKFTLRWLKEHLDTDADLDTICARLTALGLEVDGVEDKAAALGAVRRRAGDRGGAAPQRRQAEGLPRRTPAPGRRCRSSCGAPNARTGMLGGVRPAGDSYSGHRPRPQARHAARGGIERHAVQRARAECCRRTPYPASSTSPAIRAARRPSPARRSPALLGLDDPVIDVALTPRPRRLRRRARHRPGPCRGRGRHAEAAGRHAGCRAGSRARPGFHLRFPAGAEDACPLFVGRTIRGVTNRASPRWLQDRLRAVGLRPISALVRHHQFLHPRPQPAAPTSSDAETLAGDLTVHLSAGGERLLALNEKDYTLPEGVGVISDDDAVLSLGGIMGGESSAVGEETTTRVPGSRPCSTRFRTAAKRSPAADRQRRPLPGSSAASTRRPCSTGWSRRRG